jgi:hypothetical protein
VLLWKRRWAAIRGVAAGSALVAAGSALLVGMPACLAYLSSLGGISKVGTDPLVFGDTMINWRALTLAIAPIVGDRRAMIVYVGLSLLTIAAVLLTWRGSWLPRDRRFPTATMAVLLGTLLTTFHSHSYGMTLLVVPLASLLAEGHLRPLTRAVLVAGIAACVFWGIVGEMLSIVDPGLVWPSQRVISFALIAACAALLVDLWRDRRFESATISEDAAGTPPARADGHMANRALAIVHRLPVISRAPWRRHPSGWSARNV